MEIIYNKYGLIEQQHIKISSIRTVRHASLTLLVNYRYAIAWYTLNSAFIRLAYEFLGVF